MSQMPTLPGEPAGRPWLPSSRQGQSWGLPEAAFPSAPGGPHRLTEARPSRRPGQPRLLSGSILCLPPCLQPWAAGSGWLGVEFGHCWAFFLLPVLIFPGLHLILVMAWFPLFAPFPFGNPRVSLAEVVPLTTPGLIPVEVWYLGFAIWAPVCLQRKIIYAF